MLLPSIHLGIAVSLQSFQDQSYKSSTRLTQKIQAHPAASLNDLLDGPSSLFPLVLACLRRSDRLKTTLLSGCGEYGQFSVDRPDGIVANHSCPPNHSFSGKFDYMPQVSHYQISNTSTHLKSSMPQTSFQTQFRNCQSHPVAERTTARSRVLVLEIVAIHIRGQ